MPQNTGFIAFTANDALHGRHAQHKRAEAGYDCEENGVQSLHSSEHACGLHQKELLRGAMQHEPRKLVSRALHHLDVGKHMVVSLQQHYESVCAHCVPTM